MEVNIHHAKTNLSKLIAAAESGEEVVIARNGKPAVKLVRFIPPVRKARAAIRLPRPLGRLKGLIPVPSEEDWTAFAALASAHSSLTTDGDL